MSEDIWHAVDDFLDSLHPADRVLGEIRAGIRAGDLPDISVSFEQGRLLTVLAKAVTARTILEIGTLGGYSAVCLARALPSDGRLISLEIDASRGRFAERNLTTAGLSELVTVVVGPALETLPGIETQHPGGFDLIFIDADKETYPDYWRWSLRLAHPGTLIVADNVVRNGAVANLDDHDPMVEGVREYLKLATTEPTVLTSVMQTVGAKGYDGLSVSIVVR
jgi:predicted O-methyltransferase YrrM